jgi:hypothetical protein
MFFTLVVITCISFSVGTTESKFSDQEQTSGNSYGAWTSLSWIQTTQSDFEAGVRVNSNTSANPDNVCLDREILPAVLFAMTGDGTDYFYTYDIGSDSWTVRSSVPDMVSEGGALVYDGGNSIYAMRGGWSADFWRYDISSNRWNTLSGTPDKVHEGGALTYVGGKINAVYALGGGGSASFWRYDISSDSWNTLKETSEKVNAGGALAYTGEDSIYAMSGGETPNFWRYDISSDIWNTMSEMPDKVRGGGALTYAGGSINSVYAFPGGGSTNFLVYNIAKDYWSTQPSPTPDGQNNGAALAYDGSFSIYALQGLSHVFWRYTIADDTWSDEAVSDLPKISVGWGGSLVYVPSSLDLYYNSGTLASQVKDTGETGSRWDALEWDEGVFGGTDITFDVRASDTPFLMNNTTLSWTSVGGTSPVYAGLPRGRYFQWRASLTTADTTITPTLNEVRAYYT